MNGLARQWTRRLPWYAWPLALFILPALEIVIVPLLIALVSIPYYTVRFRNNS
jgi:hypothetical protein